MVWQGVRPQNNSRAPRLGIVILLAWALSAVPGCGGCGSSKATKPAVKPRSEETEEDILKEKKPEKPKPPFEPAVITAFPADTASDSTESATQVFKPGHWQVISLQTKSNLADFVGTAEMQVADSQMKPLPILDTQFYLRTQRGASLPKGQDKQLETLSFVPEGRTTSASQLKLVPQGSSAPGGAFPLTLLHMPAFSYHFLVLTPERNGYGYLKQLDSTASYNENVNDNEIQFYRVSIPSLKAKLPLSSDPLCWTSIAYILWDDADPSLLKKEQQEALIDWLHWGGNLIISGPGSLGLLKGSFLAPYLPATEGPACELSAVELKPLSDTFSLVDETGDKTPIVPATNWVGVQLELAGAGDLHSQNQFVPGTGDLIASARVGRGRITVTAFRLRQRELINWRSFDSFFNGCLLRREPRTFGAALFHESSLDWAHHAGQILDPTFNTPLRLLSRDAGRMSISRSTWARPPDELLFPPGVMQGVSPRAQGFQVPPDATINYCDRGGVCAWNDRSKVSEAARATLRDAAGITIPSSEFVLKMLGWYLLLIAPANYLIFRILGRVEWAWAAVPVMALGAAGLVIWAAQLDIGFARSRSEVTLVELFGQHPRAHVTRYQALYTSLATSYHVELPGGAHALPMARATRGADAESPLEVDFRYDQPAELSGFDVSSNSTDMIHSEQLLDFQGVLHLTYPSENPTGEWSVFNPSELTLRNVWLLCAGPSAENETAVDYYFAAELPAGNTATFAKLPQRPDELNVSPKENEDGEDQSAVHAGHLDSLFLRRSVCDEAELEPGEIRLVGEFNAELPGVAVMPAAKQNKQLGLLVAHLHYEVAAKPTRDANLRPKPRPVTWEENDNALLAPAANP